MASLNRFSPSSLPLTIFSDPTAVSDMLYNGKSNRSRGWKSKKPADTAPAADGRPLRWPIIKRFDGAAKCCSGWDSLSKDPELWYRNGNCYVHLYAKGESHRGPSFRVPFACLLDAHCHPLIEAFVDRSISETEAFQNGRVDLYIPAPWTANKLQAYCYHLELRNLFAWIFRRSVVGEHLGHTIIALANTLEKYRQPGADNRQDLLAYLDEEGYLDLRNEPTHALALLHLAETFQMTDLYLEAFAHCAGMSDRLHKHNEYSRISSASRKLIRHARVDMDFRLSRVGAMLSDLLLEELSEAHLGLSTAARAHLDRFRTYIHGFYATRFGEYPPGPSDKKCRTIFKPEVYRIMRADFAALYEYLVDHHFTFTADRNPSSLAQGGLCTLQLVHEFDCRHKFVPLPNPLPLLPEPVKAPDSRKRSSIAWLVGGQNFRETKGRPGQRLLSYASLMRATNHSKAQILRNRLVVAYRQFEEESLITAHKAESTDRASVGPADARKVRWLFIYAVYQTLLSCAEPLSELDSNQDLGYHLNISTSTTPPWKAEGDILTVPDFEGRGTVKPSNKIRPAEQKRTVSPIPLLPPGLASSEEERQCGGLDIRPDVDYFALTHPKEGTTPPTGSANEPAVLRTMSLTRKMSIRRPLSRLRSSSSQKSRVTSSGSLGRASILSRKLIYHEIIVHGYGNGTHEVQDASLSASSSYSQESAAQPSSPKLSVRTDNTTITRRSDSTSSRSSYRSAQSRSSAHSGPSAVPSEFSSTPTSPTLPISMWQRSPQSQTQSEPACNESITDASTLYDYEHSLGDRPSYTELKVGSNDVNYVTVATRSLSFRDNVRSMYSSDDMLLASAVTEPGPPPLPRRSSKRLMRPNTDTNARKRWSMVDIPSALREAETETSSASDSASDYGSSSDDGAVFYPQPLRIHKVPTPVEREHPALAFSPVLMEVSDLEPQAPTATADDLLRSGLFAAPPCAWEKFHDLGGLQAVHPALR